MAIGNEKQLFLEIMSCCESTPVNLPRLKELSRKEGGFQSNRVRARVWSKLLGILPHNLLDYKKLIRPHRDERQLRVDIDRSFWSLDIARNWGERRLNRKRADLSNIITALLSHNPGYYYYQGLHDVISVLLLVFNDTTLTFAASEEICRNYLADFMRRDFTSLSKMMKLIMVLIKNSDQELSDFLESSGTEPFFATSWLITWLSHDIRSLDQIGRIFDVLLCSPPEYCFYLCATLVLMNRNEILELECDFSTVHNKLSRLLKKAHTPHQSSNSNLQSFSCEIDFESLIERADMLMKEIPPSELLSLADPGIKQVICDNSLLLFNPKDPLSDQNFNLISLLSDNKLREETHLQNITLKVYPNPHLAVLFAGWVTFLQSESLGISQKSTLKISWSFVREMGKRIWRGIISPITMSCGIDRKQTRTIIAIALTGVVISVGVWAFR